MRRSVVYTTADSMCVCVCVCVCVCECVSAGGPGVTQTLHNSLRMIHTQVVTHSSSLFGHS